MKQKIMNCTFAILARHGFIAKDILLSLEN